MGRRVDKEFNHSVTIEMEKVDRVGTYELREKASKGFGKVLETIGTTKDYYTTETSTGTLTITKLDRSHRIISGTFSFRAQNRYNLSEFVDVTDGRFDVKY
ncbi:hypothetical protein GCM10027189_30150 [Rufibacter soli]